MPRLPLRTITPQTYTHMLFVRAVGGDWVLKGEKILNPTSMWIFHLFFFHPPRIVHLVSLTHCMIMYDDDWCEQN